MSERDERKATIREIEDLLDDADMEIIYAILAFIKEIV